MNDNIIVAIIVIALSALFIYAVWRHNFSSEKYTNMTQSIVPSPTTNMLLTNHLIDLMQYIIRTVNQLPGQQAWSNKLVDNINQVVNIFSQRYPGRTDYLAFLFKKNITGFFDVVGSLITRDAANYAQNAYSWNNNADLIAYELQKIDSNYQYDKTRKLLADYQEALEQNVRVDLSQKCGLEQADNLYNATNQLFLYLI